ncbi:MAG: hypothetical protein ACYS8W_11270 [Planctomycetota bacterium]
MSRIFILLAFCGSTFFSGCAFVPLGDFGRLPMQADSEDPQERPGFRRTAVGLAADIGALPFGYAFYPFGCGLMLCVENTAEMGAYGTAPGVWLGGFIFGTPVFILKGIFVDVPFYSTWILRTKKSKLRYYIGHIGSLSESEYEHLVELAGVDHGDVSIEKHLTYWVGVPDERAVKRWRNWWDKVKRLSYNEILEYGEKSVKVEEPEEDTDREIEE